MITHSCSSQSAQPLDPNKSICLHSLVRFGLLPFELMMSAQIWIKHPFIAELHTHAVHPQAPWHGPHLCSSVVRWQQNMPARQPRGYEDEGKRDAEELGAKWMREKGKKGSRSTDGWGRHAGRRREDAGSFDVRLRYFDTQWRWHDSIQSPPLLGCASMGICIQTLIDDGTCTGIRIKTLLTLPSTVAKEGCQGGGNVGVCVYMLDFCFSL